MDVPDGEDVSSIVSAAVGPDSGICRVSGSDGRDSTLRSMPSTTARRIAVVASLGEPSSGSVDPGTCFSASASWEADWNRASGSFARQRRMMASSSAGMSGRRVDGGGGSWFRTMYRMLLRFAPAKGLSPVTIS